MVEGLFRSAAVPTYRSGYAVEGLNLSWLSGLLLAAALLIVQGHASRWTGGASFPFIQAAAKTLAGAMPHAEYRTLAGQRHDVSSDVLAPVLMEFFNAQPGARKQNRAPGRSATQRR